MISTIDRFVYCAFLLPKSRNLLRKWDAALTADNCCRCHSKSPLKFPANFHWVERKWPLGNKSPAASDKTMAVAPDDANKAGGGHLRESFVASGLWFDSTAWFS